MRTSPTRQRRACGPIAVGFGSFWFFTSRHMLVLLLLAKIIISLTVKSAEFGSWSKFVSREPNNVCLGNVVMFDLSLYHRLFGAIQINSFT
jgi:hypothetical protein